MDHYPLYDELLDVFKPLFGFRDPVYLLLELFERKLLWYTSESIALQENDGSFIPSGGGRETGCHRLLKYNAYLLLKAMGDDNPSIEVDYKDVYSPKLNIWIECGHTSEDRILHSLSVGIEFWILQYVFSKPPYPQERKDVATLYKFHSAKGCRELIGMHRRESVTKVKESIRKEVEQ